MNVRDQLAQMLAQLLRDDERRVLMGEDIADGTMMGLSRACAEDEALAGRLISTPLVPVTGLAHAAGVAMSGLRPIVVLPSGQALLEGLAGLREAALLEWRTGGATQVPVVYIAPSGPGFGLGADAAEGVESVLTRIPNLRVLVAGTPSEAAAVLRAAAEFWAGEQPTVLLVPRSVLTAQVDETAEAQQLQRPFAAAQCLRPGQAATVFTWGETVGPTLAAVEQSGVDAAVIDVECLAPLSHQPLVDYAKETGKIVIVHAGPRSHGVGAELAAMFADEAILTLDAPVTRVTGHDAPLRSLDEQSAVPSVAAIASAITAVATY